MSDEDEASSSDGWGSLAFKVALWGFAAWSAYGLLQRVWAAPEWAQGLAGVVGALGFTTLYMVWLAMKASSEMSVELRRLGAALNRQDDRLRSLQRSVDDMELVIENANLSGWKVKG